MSNAHDGGARRPLPPPRRLPTPKAEPPTLDELARHVAERSRPLHTSAFAPSPAAQSLAQSSGRARTSQPGDSYPTRPPPDDIFAEEILEVPPRPSDIFDSNRGLLRAAVARSWPAPRPAAPRLSTAPVAREPVEPPKRRRNGAILISWAVGVLFGAGILVAARPWQTVRTPAEMRGGVAGVVEEIAGRLPAPAPGEAGQMVPGQAADAPLPPSYRFPIAGNAADVSEPYHPGTTSSTPVASRTNASDASSKGASKDTSSNDGSAKDTASKDTGSKDVGSQDTGSQDTGSKDASSEPGPFDEQAARGAIGAAMGRASACADGKTRGSGRIIITIAPSGRATRALLVDAPGLLGTPVGSCIARALSGITVPPFSGAPVTVTKSISIR